MKWTNSWSAAATFEGEFSNITASHAGKGAGALWLVKTPRVDAGPEFAIMLASGRGPQAERGQT
jgi:hypothetical protein